MTAFTPRAGPRRRDTRPLRRNLRILAAFCLLSPGMAWGATTNAAKSAAAPAYGVEFRGIDDSGLRDSLRAVSQLVALADRPPPTPRALRRRMDDDVPRLDALLRSRGFYAANIASVIEPAKDGPPTAVFRIAAGPAYSLARYDIRPTPPGEPSSAVRIDLDKLRLRLGSVAESARIVGAETRLLALLARRGYPLARIGKRRVVADHEKRTLSVDLPVALGPKARFGPLRVEGLRDVLAAAVLRQVAWRRGDAYDAGLVDKTRDALRATGLFGSVLVKHGDAVDANGEIPMTITVTERDQRSIGVGASYSSTEGPSGRVFWEHRNLFGNGERLNLRAEGGLVTQGVFGSLRLPDIRNKDQDYLLDARVAREDQEGFTSTETVSTLRVERRFADIYSASAGIGIDRSVVEENAAKRDFTLLVLPFTLRRDTTDSLLDPTTGGLATLTVTPSFGMLGTDTDFYVARLFDSVHYRLTNDKSVVLAGWGRVSTVLGDDTLALPANRRIYAGGAGSVRGYPLDSIGRLDAQNDPVGGRSATEAGLELRWKVSDPFGVVGFVETGGVYDKAFPDWGQELQWGAGIGVRYYSAIGPLRLDVAVPLNRRNEIDDAFQILVSLGQAF